MNQAEKKPQMLVVCYIAVFDRGSRARSNFATLSVTMGVLRTGS